MRTPRRHRAATLLGPMLIGAGAAIAASAALSPEPLVAVLLWAFLP